MQAGLEVAAATPVDYLPERAAKPPDQRGSYRVIEDTMTIAGKRKRDPVLRVRRMFVWSSARPGAAATSRARKLDRARDDLDRLTRGLGAATTRPSTRHRCAWRPSPTPAGSPACCAPRSGSTRPPANRPCLVARPGGAGARAGQRRLVRVADQPGPRACRRRRGPGPLQGPRSRRTPLRCLQGAAGGRGPVCAVQPTHPGAGHRDLPGPARLLPGRTPGAPRHRPRPHPPRAVCRPTGQAYRAADLPGAGRLAAHPRQRPRSAGHPPTPTAARPTARTARCRPTQPPDQPEDPMDSTSVTAARLGTR